MMQEHWSALIRNPKTKDDFLDIASGFTDVDWQALESSLAAEEAQSEREASLSVFKDASGRYRWILLSSTAHRDRDGEIVSTKALAQDVIRADADKDYGPLRWWHIPGADIGDCDFNALSGRMLVESGTFRSEVIGEAVYKAQDSLQASLGFRHPITEPDHEKVYHNIRRFERSLTPRGRAANPFTMLVVKQGGKTMEDEKLAEFKAMFGHIKDDVVQGVLAQIQATQKAADAVAAYKEAEATPPPVEAAPTLTPAAVANFITSNTGSVGVNTIPPSSPLTIDTSSSLAFASMATKPEEEATSTGDEYAGDMLPQALATLVASEVAKAVAPYFQGVVETVKALGESRVKSDDIALLQEQQARQSQEDARLRAAVEEKMKALETQLKAARTELDELTGEQPRAVKSHRASQSPDTVVGDAHALKGQQPEGFDPNFVSFLVGQDGALPPQ
jgi:hypothetical protein